MSPKPSFSWLAILRLACVLRCFHSEMLSSLPCLQDKPEKQRDREKPGRRGRKGNPQTSTGRWGPVRVGPEPRAERWLGASDRLRDSGPRVRHPLSASAGHEGATSLASRQRFQANLISADVHRHTLYPLLLFNGCLDTHNCLSMLRLPLNLPSQ